MALKYRRVNTVEYQLVRLLMLLNIWWLGIRAYGNPKKALKVLRTMLGNFKDMMGKERLVRAFHNDGKYSWDIYNPAWPSKAFNSFFTNHLHEIEPVSKDGMALRRLLIAITKRCPLQCEHCSEAATLYKDDVLSYEAFIDIIDPLVKKGVGQLVYSGGEPIVRFDDLLKFIKHYRNECDQWIYTSAYGLTLEKARQLKAAGLNGAAISLDHHIEAAHNAFRGNKKSYYWVLEGIKNLQEVGVMVAINVCPTKMYIADFGMEPFVALASKLHVPIINILEPRAVGNYQDKDVELDEKSKEVLLRVSNKYNYTKALFNQPTVMYPAAFRKSMPCGGGKSYLLLDYDGSLYPCPFCKVPMPTVKSDLALCEAV